MHQKLLKEGNGDHKYLRCLYLRDKQIEVIPSEIALDKVNLDFAELLKINIPEMTQVLLSNQT